MIVKLLTEHHLEFLSLKGGCRGSSESTHVKMSNCWKSHALAHILLDSFSNLQSLKDEDNRNILIYGERCNLGVKWSILK